MSDEQKKKLFLLGARKALAFLNSFDWDKYKKSRELLNKVNDLNDI
jgi:NTE family protein